MNDLEDHELPCGDGTTDSTRASRQTVRRLGAKRTFLAELERSGASTQAIRVAVAAAPHLDFNAPRRLPSLDLRARNSLTEQQWEAALNELVQLGAFRKFRPVSPHRRVPSYRLDWAFLRHRRTTCITSGDDK
ncbi:hypothetical protein AB3X91_19110 [Paraburkholderia sp. BR14263]|uniref:hypothetical protein n=1 Tax=unclassified Paraburkholderia TaxID=2615204 RepID=UPI0034CE3D77